MSLNGSFSNSSNHTHTDIQPASRSRMINNTHLQSGNHRRDNGVRAEVPTGQSNLVRSSRTHNELHKELLLTHKRGLALSSRSELHTVLERRKRVQKDQEVGEESKTPLEGVLLRRQQKQQQTEKKEEEKVQEEAQLMEFVRVRQNLRKIHSAMQNKAANSSSATQE